MWKIILFLILRRFDRHEQTFGGERGGFNTLQGLVYIVK